jgi:hypothetical protein
MENLFKKNDSASNSPMTYIVEGFKYNLEIIPDIFLVTIGIFSILLQNASFMALGLSLLSVNLLQPLVGGYFREVVPSSWGMTTRATGMFPGTSVERMSLETTTPKTFLPSYYTMFLGTLFGWIAPLSLFYKQELDASPHRQLAANISVTFLIMFTLILLSYRYLASQDTPYGIFLGMGFGGILGFLLMICLYYGTQRRATNLYNLPLMSTSYGTKDPIYVCASSAIPSASSKKPAA